MTIGDFINLVAKMREAQKKFSRTRSQSSLVEKNSLEEVVDNMLIERSKKFAVKQTEFSFESNH